MWNVVLRCTCDDIHVALRSRIRFERATEHIELFLRTVRISTGVGWSTAVQLVELRHHLCAHTLASHTAETWTVFLLFSEYFTFVSFYFSLLSRDRFKIHRDLTDTLCTRLTHVHSFAITVMRADNALSTKVYIYARVVFFSVVVVSSA